jgi:hypothetical protein
VAVCRVSATRSVMSEGSAMSLPIPINIELTLLAAPVVGRWSRCPTPRSRNIDAVLRCPAMVMLQRASIEACAALGGGFERAKPKQITIGPIAAGATENGAFRRVQVAVQRLLPGKAASERDGC